MDKEFRRFFYGALNAMPIERGQEQGAVIAHMQAMKSDLEAYCTRPLVGDAAIENAGGGVAELENRKKSAPDLCACVRLNRSFLF